ncbi:MAG: ribosome-associated translation inhibitor RaiA [Anaerolineales bacterium]|jgi:putative sigma-54 modulation protein|nr:ribosome-associated translation inhibitor RaiA [Anaerolineales bacterium]
MTIQVEIYGRNMDVNNRLKDYVEKRATKLDRFLTDIENARVDLAHVKSARNAGDRNVAQITVRGKKLTLRAEERADDIFVAFDVALEKMERQITRYKGKHHRGRGDGTPLSEVTAPSETTDALPLEEDSDTPIIARRKQFVMVPMDEMEALEHMKLLGHEQFFVFHNANSNVINVLYQRRDGTYGLIEPEVG